MILRMREYSHKIGHRMRKELRSDRRAAPSSLRFPASTALGGVSRTIACARASTHSQVGTSSRSERICFQLLVRATNHQHSYEYSIGRQVHRQQAPSERVMIPSGRLPNGRWPIVRGQCVIFSLLYLYEYTVLCSITNQQGVIRRRTIEESLSNSALRSGRTLY